MELQIGQTVKNTITGRKEIVKTIKHGYVNGYREDLFEMVDEEITTNLNALPNELLTDIVLGSVRWNKKFYGNYICVNDTKYEISYKQREELARNFELDI